MTKLVILGGGVAGLSAWRRARAAGHDVTLVERCPRTGGLTRSIHVGGYTFDYTGHFLHLAATAHPGLLGDGDARNWKLVTRRAGCLVDGTVVPAPFQYHLGALPEPVRAACIDGVRHLLSGVAPARPERGEDLLSYFVRAFGPGVTAHFLKPYNEKLLATDLTRLSAERLNRFFPAPDPVAVAAGLAGGEGGGGTYNATFWYPQGDGIGRLVDQLAPAAPHAHATVNAVEPDRRVVIADGRELPYTHLISTIPLPDLLTACGGARAALAPRLSASGVAAFQLGVAGPPAPLLRDLHWLYVADPSLSFFRVGCYSNVSAALAPPGCHSLYVEVGVPAEVTSGEVTSGPPTGRPFAGRPGSQTPFEGAALTDRVLADLARAGLLDPGRVEVLLRHVIAPAYVHFDFAWEQVVPAALADLAACGIHCAGRYGRWDYVGMEDAILGAAAAVDALPGV
ncbi:NAD(P)-binding protein [Myxococcota bacterium]|nr:NAD(P)-binding protein [Myxococcota bacterium]